MSSNDVEKIKEIKELIEKAKIQKAKSEGVIEKIKSDWKERYGTDDVDEVRKKQKELEEKLGETEKKKDLVYEKLVNSNDWEKLEKELEL